MAAGTITAIVLPKLGMTMTEGKVGPWRIEIGDEVEQGEEIVDIETEKITNACEAPADGVFRRRVADQGVTLPVGSLIGVIAAEDTPEANIDDFIATFKPEKEA